MQVSGRSTSTFVFADGEGEGAACARQATADTAMTTWNNLNLISEIIGSRPLGHDQIDRARSGRKRLLRPAALLWFRPTEAAMFCVARTPISARKRTEFDLHFSAFLFLATTPHDARFGHCTEQVVGSMSR